MYNFTMVCNSVSFCIPFDNVHANFLAFQLRENLGELRVLVLLRTPIQEHFQRRSIIISWIHASYRARVVFSLTMRWHMKTRARRKVVCNMQHRIRIAVVVGDGSGGLCLSFWVIIQEFIKFPDIARRIK